MEVLDRLRDDANWDEYLNFKIEQGTMPKSEMEALKEYIQQRRYVPVVDRIFSEYKLSVPKLNEVNKAGTTKKRKVFVFPQEESFVLKMISYLLRDYDDLFEDNLYSFRHSRGVKLGIRNVMRAVNLKNTYSYKVDIHNYFNSIDPEAMIRILHEKMPKETKFIHLFENVLRDPYVVLDTGEIVECQKGIMAGMPISGFLANLYLTDMDRFFLEKGIQYIRYSDDIIVFADTKEKIDEYEEIINQTLYENQLEVNEKKVIRTAPGEMIEFLGFEFLGSDINLADISVRKIKSKLRRRARKLYRWRLKKGVEGERAVRAYTRFLNRKFYDNNIRGEITWARWYFPLLTRDERLKEIDEYALQCIRYLMTGRNTKKNYNLRYKRIKELGFRSLVNSYWRFRNGTYDKDVLAGNVEAPRSDSAEKKEPAEAPAQAQ